MRTDRYKKKVKVSGIIYMHRVSDNRMTASPLKDLHMFQKLCGTKAIARVVLTTTMWTNVTKEVGERREQELKSRYWRRMLDMGSKSTRFGNTLESAWTIIDTAVQNQCPDPQTLLLQEELVDHHLRLSETEAGRALHAFLQGVFEEQRNRMQKMREKNSYGLLRDLEELEKSLKETVNQLENMKIPIKRRLRLFFSIKKIFAVSPYSYNKFLC